jgi:glycosyltransferase involved in cell wall biosynthesis
MQETLIGSKTSFSEMQNISSKRLLVLAPHFRTFIKDQIVPLAPFFNRITTMIPIPYFAKIAVSLPIVGNQFDFVRPALASKNSSCGYSFLFPKFFTLPIPVMQKRNHLSAARSCLRMSTSMNLRFDLIHAHFMTFGYIGAILKETTHAPLVVTAHGGDVYDLPFRKSWYKALARYVLKSADQVITVSQFNAKKLLSIGVSSSKLDVIPNGYDPKIFKMLPQSLMRQKLGLPLNKKILLSVGNLVDAKGHAYLIDAVNIILKKQADAILVIVGSGPLEKKLRRKITNLCLSEKILLVGRRIHDEICMWMNASDIFVLPSLREGFPTVIPEAFACGKPVIGTRVGGIPEALSNHEVGLLVDPKDPVDLSNAILNALNRKWRASIITDYSKIYSWNNIVRQILEIYRSLSLSC